MVVTEKYQEAARLCPKVCGQDTKRWEDWIFVFTQQHRLQVRQLLDSPADMVSHLLSLCQAIIPYVPTESPTLGHLVYEMILAYFLSHDRQVCPDLWGGGIDIDLTPQWCRLF